LFAGGASYSPEYYINIRTGIHYFPKGNAATIDPASNRFKSGLNRIEEKHDEVKIEFFASISNGLWAFLCCRWGLCSEIVTKKSLKLQNLKDFCDKCLQFTHPRACLPLANF
jgi:hypothetical protein